MANINPIQMNQPVKALNSNQSMNGDSQESFIDQSFASFPDELEAAKGQSQNTSSSADSSEPKPEVVGQIDLQNLPVTAAVGVLNPANIAAAIQVMAPVDTAAIEVINLDQLQLASLTNEVVLSPEQVVDLAPVLDTSADAQFIAQNLVSSESLAIASQNIQNTLTDSKAAEVVQQNVAPVIAQVVEQSLVVDAESAVATSVNTSSDIAAALLNQSDITVDQQQDTAELSVDSQSTSGVIVAAPVLNVDAGLANQVVNSGSNVDTAVVDLTSKIQASAAVATASVNAAPLTNEQSLASIDQNNSKDLAGLAQQAVSQDVDIATQANSSAEASKQATTLVDVDLNVANEATKLVVSNQVSEDVQVAANVSTPTQITSNVIDAVEVQTLAPVIAEAAPGLKLDGQTSVKVISNQVITDKDSLAQAQVSNAVVANTPVSTESSFTVDTKTIQVGRDDLAQSEDILAARAENAKLAKLDTGIQVDQLSAVDVNDLNKVDAVNNGIIMTDVSRSTFAANANQELRLAQAAPVKLEPHNVSLASGPLNIEVMRVLKEGGGRVIMEVTPPDQGTLQLDLRLDNQGKAILIVDGASDSTRARLEQGSAELRQQLADMGLQLSLNMRQKSDSEAQFRFASSSDGFNNSNNRRNDSSVVDQVGGIISNQINTDGRVHLYA